MYICTSTPSQYLLSIYSQHTLGIFSVYSSSIFSILSQYLSIFSVYSQYSVSQYILSILSQYTITLCTLLGVLLVSARNSSSDITSGDDLSLGPPGRYEAEESEERTSVEEGTMRDWVFRWRRVTGVAPGRKGPRACIWLTSGALPIGSRFSLLPPEWWELEEML